jgi:PAS domain-containing protein
VATFLDVTERERSTEQIRIQAALLDAVGEAVVATDVEGRITYLNRAAQGIYG